MLAEAQKEVAFAAEMEGWHAGKAQLGHGEKARSLQGLEYRELFEGSTARPGRKLEMCIDGKRAT